MSRESAAAAAPLVEAADRGAWRDWLAANHDRIRGAWLVRARPGSTLPSVDYEASVEEALCFGWVDGQLRTLDAARSALYFAPRRRGSPWAASNRARVERLAAAGRMAPAGLAVVERAQADGSWSVLEPIERLEIPPDLAAAFAEVPGSAAAFAARTPAVRRMALWWIASAKRPATRAARIRATIAGGPGGPTGRANPSGEADPTGA